MQYRELPHDPSVKLSIIGLGMGGVHHADEHGNGTIEAVVRRALDAGVNFFDFIPSEASAYPAYGKVLTPIRNQVYLQMHLGCDYSSGKYGWTQDLEIIKRDFQRQLDVLNTDYADFGFIHCIDEDSDLDGVFANGLWDYALELKERGVIRHLACSTHNMGIAKRMIATGKMDLLMLSINPMYDYTDESEYGKGEAAERAEVYRLCEANGIAISVMKAFAGGQLLDAKQSPFRIALTHNQCIQYALDIPGVASVLPGVQSMDELETCLAYLEATPDDCDYSVLGTVVPEDTKGRCVYCNHCHPCPAGLNIAMINKYYDLARLGDAMAADHYRKIDLHAGDCTGCGHCDNRCPFNVQQSKRMQEIAQHFGR